MANYDSIPSDDRVRMGNAYQFQKLYNSTSGRLETQDAAGNVLESLADEGAFGHLRTGRGRFSSDATSAEQLTNGDCESAIPSISGGATYANRITNPPTSVVTASETPSFAAHGGTKAMKMVNATGTAGQVAYWLMDYNFTGATPRFRLGAKYVFSAYVYIPSGASNHVTNAYLQITLNGVNYTSNLVTTKDAWTLCTVTAEAPVYTTASAAWTIGFYMTLAASAAAGDCVYFDDATLLEYSGGSVFVGGDCMASGKFTGSGGTGLGVDIDKSGNAVADGNVTASGGTVTAGVAATTRGLLTSRSGSGGNKPGCTVLYSKNGTAYYFFVTDAGVLRVSATLPTADTDGSAV